MDWSGVPWPVTGDELERAQRQLAEDAASALAAAPWSATQDPLVAGCFVAFAPGEPGSAQGDQAWAAAVTWRPSVAPAGPERVPFRRPDRALRGSRPDHGPRR